MAQKIGIGVSAELDTSAVEQKINELGQKIAQANRVQFTPLKDTTADELDRIIKQFDQLRRIQGDLNRRMKETGQGDTPMLSADWDRLYVDPAVRARQMRKAFEYATGRAFHEPPPPPTPPRGTRGDGGSQPATQPSRPGPGSLSGMGVSVAQAGLNAMGPVGGVAASALGTGMAAGFGAGLMGLLGGMLALGVSKMVGAAMEKMGQAEDNAIAFDRLKRVLGDVNVSFDRLKEVVTGGADVAKVTIEESARLTTQFAKLGNVTQEHYATLADELQTGVGLSRAYGLDPTQGVGIMGQLRGLRITSDTQESRRFALLIGETIGKSGAFAKADEVMEALSNYATQQTRNAMSAANMAGFAGLFSSAVGSGIAGMDPAGANAVISRINAALSQGGAFGEASQFLSALVARDMGLDPIRMQILREGGAFATAGSMFGEGSAYARYMGRTGPGGSGTWYDATRARIERMFPGNSEDAMMMRAMAFANHMGININQAMAMLSINPNEMGGLQRYVSNLGELNSAGISSLYSAVYGSESDRVAIANELYGRTGVGALSDAERADLDRVMQEGSAEDQRQVLATLIASRDQEQTQGKDIRDSKTALENIKTAIADKLIPITQEIRQGIMYMAGKGEESPRDIIEKMMRIDSKDRVEDIENEFQRRITDAALQRGEARRAISELSDRNRERVLSGEMTLEEHQEQIAPLMEQEREAIKKDTEARKWRTKALEDERKQLEENIQKMREANPSTVGDASVSATGTGRYRPRGVGDGLPKSAGASGVGAMVDGDVADIINPNGKNTRGYRNNNPGNLEATVPWSGMVGSDGRFAQFATPEDGYIAMGSNILAYESKHGLNTIRGIISRWAPAGENNTAAYIDRVSKAMGIGPDEPLNLRDQKTLARLMTEITRHENGYLRHSGRLIEGAAGSAIERRYGTPMPEDAQAARREQEIRLRADDINVNVAVTNERGEPVAPPQQLQTRVQSLWNH